MFWFWLPDSVMSCRQWVGTRHCAVRSRACNAHAILRPPPSSAWSHPELSRIARLHLMCDVSTFDIAEVFLQYWNFTIKCIGKWKRNLQNHEGTNWSYSKIKSPVLKHAQVPQPLHQTSWWFVQDSFCKIENTFVKSQINLFFSPS